MYSHSQYGDSQYPHGPDLGQMSGQVPVDPSMGPSRFPYMPHYGSKGPDGAHIAAMANRPPYGGDYGVIGGPDPMYSQNWMLGHGYMGPTHGGKPSPYGMQGMANYHGASQSYPGAPHHYSSGGQYHPYGGSSQSPIGAGHLNLMQQQGIAGHRFTPPAGSSSTSGRPDMGNSGMAEGSSYMGNVPGSVHHHSSTGSGSPHPSWPSQPLHPHGPSTAPPSSTGSGGRSGTGGWPPYHSPEYPSSGRPGTPGTSQGSASSSSSANVSRLKVDKAGSSSQPGMGHPTSSSSSSSVSSSQKQVDLSSPRNSELPKAPSISCLREALLATTSITSTSQPYASYSSPRMMIGGVGGGGGGSSGDHQPSPLTPSSHHPMTPESGSLVSPPQQLCSKKTATTTMRQDSQLSSSSQERSCSRQNSLTHQQQQQQQQQGGSVQPDGSSSQVGLDGGGTGTSSMNSNTVPHMDGGGGRRTSGDNMQMEGLLGMKNEQLANTMAPSPQLGGVQQQQSSSTSSSPLPNSAVRAGGLDGESVLGSPRVESPHNTTVNTTVASDMHDRQSPAPAPPPARPDLLGFPVRSPSFRGEKQPSPLTEDTKNARKFTMSPIDRRHPSIASQYNGDQKKKDFLDLLFNFLEKEGVQVSRLPTICKAPFDLYQIFNSVQHHGGFLNVVEKRLWRDVIKTAYGSTITNPTSSSVRTLQQYYKKLLLPYECHIGSTDVSSCLSKIDNSVPSRQTSTSSPCGSQLSSEGESNKSGDKVPNHLSEALPPNVKVEGKKTGGESRVNGETLCAVPEPGVLLDGEHVVERVNSQGNSLPPSTLAGGGGGESANGSGPKLNSVDPQHPSSTSSSCSSAVSQLGSQAREDGAPPAPLKTVSSNDLDDDQSIDFPDDSQDSYPQPDLSEPLPEMSVQEAESVLGISPITYPNHDGPGTPSTGVPSPTHFPSSSHFQQQKQQQRVGSIPQPGTPSSVGTPTGGSRGGGGSGGGGGGGGSQDYAIEGSDIGGASAAAGSMGINSAPAPSYPPPYPNPIDVPGGYPPHHLHPSHHSPYAPHPSGPSYPPYNNPMYPPNRQYGDMPGDYPHHGMSASGMMHPPYSSGRGPYPGMMGSGGSSSHHRNSIDYHHPHHHSPYHHPHSQVMGGVRDVPPYPSPHGMPPSADWHWQQQQQQQQHQQQHQQQRQQQMMSVQQSHMYQRMQQHHQQQQQQQAAMMRQQSAMVAAQQQQQQQQQQSSARSSPAISSPETSKMNWQHDTGHSSLKSHPPASSAPSLFSGSSSSKLSNEKVRSSPKPPPHPRHHAAEALENKGVHGGKAADTVTGVASVGQAAALAETLKRSLPDWGNCVEGTKPQLVKRRKLYGYHCGHVEPWRLMMSLKSGLLADSTWALDTLTILLHDENTYGYFNLRHHHSLLNTLVDHFKVTLEAIFDVTFEDTEKYILGHKGTRIEDDVEDLKERTTLTSMVEACQTDFDVLAAKSRVEGQDGEESQNSLVGDEGAAKAAKFKGLSIPVAETYDMDQLRLGKSDVLSHIMVSTYEKSYFPEEPADLDLISERRRVELEEQCQLQRVDQTPVGVLLRREALLSQIPFHKFGRLSHSPRRRERNFFGSTRSLDGRASGSGGGGSVHLSVGVEAGEETGPKTTLKDTSSRDKDKVEEGSSKKESVCKSPDGIEHFTMFGRRSSLLGRKETCPSPVLVEENEVYRKEDLPLWSVPPSKEQLRTRCECLSNILRSLTFVTGNDVEFCQHPGILVILGKLLMLHHYHLVRPKQKKPSMESDTTTASALVNSLSSESGSVKGDGQGKTTEDSLADDGSAFFVSKSEDQQQQGRHFAPAKEEWWWDCLGTLREDALVILANISGQLDLSMFPEAISFPIINGLLHWLVCPASVAIDPLPDSSKVYSQSPQRLVVETFAKMTISEANVDLILATPPLMRLDVVFSRLGQMVCQKKHPVVRQFALVLLSNLAQGHECCSRLIAQQKMVISHLLECLEVAEHMVCTGQGSFEGGYAKDDPSSLSVAMLRRAATTLYCISRVPANRTAFLPYRNRILYLSTSQYVEPSVSSILMDMLYEFGKL